MLSNNSFSCKDIIFYWNIHFLNIIFDKKVSNKYQQFYWNVSFHAQIWYRETPLLVYSCQIHNQAWLIWTVARQEFEEKSLILQLKLCLGRRRRILPQPSIGHFCEYELDYSRHCRLLWNRFCILPWQDEGIVRHPLVALGNGVLVMPDIEYGASFAVCADNPHWHCLPRMDWNRRGRHSNSRHPLLQRTCYILAAVFYYHADNLNYRS